MLPLTLAKMGEKYKIRKIGGADATRRHLLELGFVVDAYVSVVTSANGNLIVCIKESRVAIGSDLASKIMV